MFKARFWSAVVLVLIIGTVLTLGGPWLYLFTLAISAIAYFEMTKAMKVRGEMKKPCLMMQTRHNKHKQKCQSCRCLASNLKISYSPKKV